ncbi:MAG: PD40 domain-containing protein, partial [Bacteroidales bacterium]|nr:PD40 domain-containing protein [Bacteroidales bacterium]
SIAICFDKIYYDIVRRSFDQKTRTFGDEEVVFDAKSLNLSAMEPRISPDGKYLLFSLGEYGTFHIWHRGSDIRVKDLETGDVWPLEDANSDDADSFHNWSSNGRWVVFTSRRDDGLFTRVYFSYFDAQGKAHKAFMLPSANPSSKGDNVYSYNVPEFTIEPVRQSVKDLSKIISQPAGRANFAGE